MPTAALDLATYLRITRTNRCFPRQVEEKGRRKGNENGECAVEVKLSTFFSFSLSLSLSLSFLFFFSPLSLYTTIILPQIEKWSFGRHETMEVIKVAKHTLKCKTCVDRLTLRLLRSFVQLLRAEEKFGTWCETKTEELRFTKSVAQQVVESKRQLYLQSTKETSVSCFSETVTLSLCVWTSSTCPGPRVLNTVWVAGNPLC